MFGSEFTFTWTKTVAWGKKKKPLYVCPKYTFLHFKATIITILHFHFVRHVRQSVLDVKALTLSGKRDVSGDINSKMFRWGLSPQIVAFKCILKQ